MRKRGAEGLDHISGPAFGALCEAMIAARERTAGDADLLLFPYVAARRHARTRRLVTLIEGAGRGLIRYLTGRGTAESAEHTVALLAADLGLGPKLMKRPEWADAAGWVAALLRDLGLEEFGLNVGIMLPPKHPALPKIAFVWEPAGPAYTRSTLADRVLHDVLAEAAGDALIRLDHRVAAWWFERWTPGLPDDPDRAMNVLVARTVRQTEYCVAGRPTAGHKATIVETFLSSTSRNDPSPARRDIARALAQSLASLFVVRARADERSVFEEVLTGASLHVTDHRPETAYRAGGFALGRVLPLGDGTYVRSPAMMFYHHDDPKVMEAVKTSFVERAHQLGPEIAIEATLGVVSGDRTVPRDLPPAASAEEAQRLFDEAWRLLRRHLGGKPVKPPRDYPPEELAVIEAGDAEIRQFMLDRAWHEWLHAVDAQVHGVAEPGSDGILPFAPRKPTD